MGKPDGAKTLGEWYEKHQLTNINGILTWSRWQRQALSIVFDGVPLGEHPLPSDDDRYQENKLWEQDACARTLVASRLQSQIAEITTIREATEATPDFSAVLRDGRKVAIEHTRVTSEEDQLLRKRFNRTQGRIGELVAANTLPTGQVTFTFEAAPEFGDIEAVAQEMLRAMNGARAIGRRVGLEAPYTRLEALGVDMGIQEPDSPAEALVRASPLVQVDAHVVADTAATNVGKKRKKIAAYDAFGDGVWLTVWVDVRYCLPTTVLRHIQDAGLELGAFEKIAVACTTFSVIVDADGIRSQSVEP